MSGFITTSSGFSSTKNTTIFNNSMYLKYFIYYYYCHRFLVQMRNFQGLHIVKVYINIKIKVYFIFTLRLSNSLLFWELGSAKKLFPLELQWLLVFIYKQKVTLLTFWFINIQVISTIIKCTQWLIDFYFGKYIQYYLSFFKQ